MFFAYIILFTALLLSAVAAYYSIAGLTAIFAAAVIPVIIMGATLELGKVVATVWLHNNWKRINLVFKTYLVPAILFLMLLTSMGIFGFLSKAHSDQSLVSGDAMSKVAIFDEKINTEKENIAQAKKALEQMNAQVDQMLGRSDTERGAERAVSIRKNQAKERAALQAEITKSQKIIQQLQEERAPLAAEFRKVEAEVGPIKYIAALLYGDNPDQNILERAVRWVIILIVIVFDPLALCLILAGNKQLEWVREDKEKKLVNEAAEKVEAMHHPEPVTEPEPIKFNPDKIEVTPEEEELFKTLEPKQEPETVGIIEEEIKEEPIDEEMASDLAEIYHQSENPNPLPSIEEPKSLLPEQTAEILTEGVTEEAYRKSAGDYIEFEGKSMHKNVLREMRPEIFKIRPDSGDTPNVGFGTEFPKYAVMGDVFVRVDILPNRVYKFVRNKWIEMSKENSDTYLHNDGYINYLIEKIGSGEVDPEMLTATEQDMVEQYIRKSKV
jgi:hypothetical protein